MKKITVRSRGNNRPAAPQNQSRNGAKARRGSNANSAPCGKSTIEAQAERLLVSLIGETCAREVITEAKVRGMSLGDFVAEAVSRTDAIVAAPTPLPPLRGEPQFPHYTVDQCASLPCGANMLRRDLREWWEHTWGQSNAAVNLRLQSMSFYEVLRHHPYFQREAAVLRNFIESQRELSALLNELGEEKDGLRGLTPPWPIRVSLARDAMRPKEGQVAA